MAIISKQTTTTQEVKSTTSYPKLMKSEVSHGIVLFIKEKTGVVLKRGFFEVGYFSDDWNMGQFKDYEGELSLTLQNKLESE